MVKTLPQCGRGPNGASALLELGDHRRHGGRVVDPGEVEASESCSYAGLSHRSSAATVRSSDTCSTGATRGAHRLHGVQRGDRVPARHEVLGLQLGAAARRVVEPEVRQPLVPRPGHAELLGAAGRRHARHRVQRLGRGRRAEPAGSSAGARVVGAPLHPDLVDDVPAPGGEQADAVAGGEDLVEVGGQPPDREVLVDGLRHVVRRLDRQRDGGDDAEGTQRDDRAGEPRVGAVQPQHRSGRGDQVEADHGGRQAAQGRAGAVGPGRHRAGDRDVRQRAEVVQRQARAPAAATATSP